MEINSSEEPMMAAKGRPHYDRARIDREPYLLSSQAVVRELVAVLGRKTVAYIAGLDSVLDVVSWLNDKGSQPSDDCDGVLRAALHATRYIVDLESVPSASAWFVGANSYFDFDSPASILRRRGFEVRHDLVKAARAFVADALAAADWSAGVQIHASGRDRSS